MQTPAVTRSPDTVVTDRCALTGDGLGNALLGAIVFDGSAGLGAQRVRTQLLISP